MAGFGLRRRRELARAFTVRARCGQCHWGVGRMCCARMDGEAMGKPVRPMVGAQPGRAHRGGSGFFAIRPRADGAQTADGAVPVCRALAGQTSSGHHRQPAPGRGARAAALQGRGGLHLERICEVPIARAQSRRTCAASGLGLRPLVRTAGRDGVATPRASAANTPCWPAAVAWSP